MIVKGENRIGCDEALDLLINGDLLALGKRADKIRRSIHPDGIVTFVVDRNVNYTNICDTKCSFCAFYKSKDAQGSYVLTYDQIFEKIAELVAQGGTQLLMQGGINPDLKIDFFEELFRQIKKQFPTIQNHSLSPAEVIGIAANSALTLDDTLFRLRNAGLDSIPGGGAEILVDEVRSRISPKKIGSEQWGEVMLKAAAVSYTHLTLRRRG